MHNALGALSPLDGRYSDSVKELNAYFSEAALMRYRIYIEVEYLIALGHEKKISELRPLSERQQKSLRKAYPEIDINSAQLVKDIESDTNHDVKAIEYYIQKHCKTSLHPWIHFVPVKDDFSDLEEKFNWSQENIDQTIEIAYRGYITIFDYLQNIDKYFINSILKYRQ